MDEQRVFISWSDSKQQKVTYLLCQVSSGSCEEVSDAARMAF